MAAKKASISILMTADAAKAKAAFADVEKRAGSLQNQMGSVAKSIGGAFATGAIIRFTGSALKAAEAANTSESRIRQVATSMGVFGDEVGIVTNRLTALADQTARNTGIDQNQIKLTQAKLLTFKNLALTADEVGGAFDRATMAAIDMAAAGFGEASTNAVQLGKALQDPIKGITALNRSGITFSEDQKKVIAALVETNRVGEAQAIILKAIEEQVGGTAEATANDTDKMRVSFRQLQEQIGEQLVPVFATVLEVVRPLIDAFAALPSGVQKVVVIAALAGSTFKAVSTSLQGLGVAAGTANRALGAVGLVLTAAVSVYNIYNRGKQKAIANTNAFVDALKAEAGGQENATDTHIANLLSVEKLQATYQALGLATADVAAIIRGETNPTFEAAAQVLEDVRRGTTDIANANAILGDQYGVTYSELKTFVAEVNNQEKALADAEAQVALNVKTQTELGVVTDDNTEATEELNQALEDQENQLKAVVNATLSAFNAQLGYESQTWATEDAVAAYNDTLGSMIDGTYEGTDAARDLAKAENEVYENALRQAAAAAQLAADTAKASGEQLTAAETAKIQAEELQRVADTLDPGSPLRAQLAAYIGQLNAIPREVTTTFRTIIEEARITAGTQSGMGSGRTSVTYPGRAMGGFVAQNTPYLVGENGPELFIPTGAGRISPNAGGDTIVINVGGSVITERDLIETVRRGLIDSQRSGRQLVY